MFHGTDEGRATSVNLLDAIKAQLGDREVEQISSVIGESRERTSAAISTAAPALLAGLAKAASSRDGLGRLWDALGSFDTGTAGSVASMLSGGNTQDIISKGSSLLGSLLGGNTLGSIGDAIGRIAGIGKSGVGSLLGLLVPVILSVLGREKRRLGFDMSGLGSLLDGQKKFLSGLLPDSIASALGLRDEFAREAVEVGERVSSTPRQAATSARYAGDFTPTRTKAATTPRPWLSTLLPLAAAIALGLLLWNWFSRSRQVARMATPTEVIRPVSETDRPISEVDTLGNRVSSLFGNLTDTLDNVTDVESARAAVPKIERAIDTVGGIRTGMERLSANGRDTITSQLSSGLGRLESVSERVLGIPGVGDILRPTLDKLFDAIKGLIGVRM